MKLDGGGLPSGLQEAPCTTADFTLSRTVLMKTPSASADASVAALAEQKRLEARVRWRRRCSVNPNTCHFFLL